jgi:hypothetical protein
MVRLSVWKAATLKAYRGGIGPDGFLNLCDVLAYYPRAHAADGGAMLHSQADDVDWLARELARLQQQAAVSRAGT